MLHTFVCAMITAARHYATLHVAKTYCIRDIHAIHLCNLLIGYARVSTNEQDAAAQVQALKSAGCEIIFREKASGGRWERPELHRLLGQIRKGDVVVVWKLDRLARSLKDVLVIVDRIQKAKGASAA